MADVFEPGIPVDFTKAIDKSAVKGRTAIVTGGASGIGLGIASDLADCGASVLIADFNEVAGKQATESIKARGGSVQFIKTDVASWESQEAAFALAAESSPDQTIDIIVTAAGISGLLRQEPHPSKHNEPIKPPVKTMEVNLTGTYYSVALALWYFTHSPPNPSKQFLFIASMAGYVASARDALFGDYLGSKYGVRGIWQSLRLSSDQFGGARFNLVAPFFIDTPIMTRGAIDALRSAGNKTGTVADVVDAAMRCLCDTGVSGRAVAACGGEANGGAPGSANFDLGDEVASGLGGKALVENAGKLIEAPPSAPSS